MAEVKQKDKTEEPKKYKVFNIEQMCRHPETGEILITEEQIKDGLNHRTITRYAYILHDKDVYTEEDEKKDPKRKAGTKKNDHYHIVVETAKNKYPVENIAKWFNVPPNQIKLPKGRGAFLDCVEYLTHEHEKQQKLGKYLYPNEEVKSNFDFRKELDDRNLKRLKYGKDLSLKEQFRYDVLVNGKTLIQCYEEDPLAYAEDSDKLRKLRLDYIHRQKAPETRINYYVSGRGGLGKGLCSRALARSLFPNIKEDDELFFIVGNGNATFEGYDGQPVIIWDDMRAVDLLTVLGGRGNVFNVLDTHPTKQRQNIKYGSINLCNTVNIINSIQTYKEFLDGLAGEYTAKSGELMKSEDKGQSYRRVPFIINLHEEDFDLLINKGFMEHSKNFHEYEEYINITGNFQKVRVMLRNNEEMAKQIESNMLSIPKQKFDEVIEREQQKIEVTDDILAQFADYGKQKKKAKPKEPEQNEIIKTEIKPKDIKDMIINDKDNEIRRLQAHNEHLMEVFDKYCLWDKVEEKYIKKDDLLK